MRRIAIIGLPGSGKSTFATKVGQVLQIPVHHLDKHQFVGKTKRNKQEFLAIQRELLAEDAWIIEGCSFSTWEMRFARADTVIYFRYSRVLCLWRVFKRALSEASHHYGHLHGVNWLMIKYIWAFDREKRGAIEELKRKYPEVVFYEFRGQADADAFFNRLRL